LGYAQKETKPVFGENAGFFVSGVFVFIFIISKRGGLEMKKVIAMFFSFLLLFAGIAHADIMNVLSQEYSIEAYASAPAGMDYHWVSSTYQETSSVPVSTFIHSPLVPQVHGVSKVWASANGGVTSEYAWLETSSSVGGEPDCFGKAYVSASITFSPLISTMLVT
jgi:hypothetical protein